MISDRWTMQGIQSTLWGPFTWWPIVEAYPFSQMEVKCVQSNGGRHLIWRAARSMDGSMREKHSNLEKRISKGNRFLELGLVNGVPHNDRNLQQGSESTEPLRAHSYSAAFTCHHFFNKIWKVPIHYKSHAPPENHCRTSHCLRNNSTAYCLHIMLRAYKY